MGGARSYPKAVRLRRRSEFLGLQRDGRRRHTSHLVVIRRPTRGLTRLGVTVSSRVGNAVVRNRIKRLLRDVFRHRRTDIAPPVDVIIIAKPGADSLTHAQAAFQFAQALDLPVPS